VNLDAKGEKALADADADGRSGWVGGGAVDLHGVIEGKIVLETELVLVKTNGR